MHRIISGINFPIHSASLVLTNFLLFHLISHVLLGVSRTLYDPWQKAARKNWGSAKAEGAESRGAEYRGAGAEYRGA